jgi:hypothetical protein
MNANQKNRKRIVINLDQPVGGMGAQGGQVYGTTRKPRRWLKVVAILLVLTFIGMAGLVVGGFFWWRHYQTTPAYSVALIIDAAQRDDMVAFGKQVDDDAIARNLVSEVSKKASDRYGVALNAALQKQIESMIPSLIPRLKDTIHQEVAKELKEIAAKSEPKPFIIVAIAVQRLVTINTEGDNARATAQMPNRTIELALQRSGDQWKVTEFRDEVLIQRVVDGVMKDLPAIGGFDLSPFLKPLRKGKAR